MRKSNATAEVLVTGVGVSAGVVVGKAYILAADDDEHVAERAITPAEIPREISRFEDAVIATRRQINKIQRGVLQSAGRKNATIFEAHLMVLDDSAFVEEVIARIASEQRNCEALVQRVANDYAAALLKVSDAYLRERVADVRDVARRIIRNLVGHAGAAIEKLDRKSVVIARDITPSETAAMPRNMVLGFATDQGSFTSHTAIMARALEIPAVVALGDITRKVRDGDQILIDGNKGILIVNPSPTRLREYGQTLESRQQIQADLVRLRDLPARTPDGHDVVLGANIELLSELPEIAKFGAQGVGLFRTEYLYLSRRTLPSEEEQVQAYSAVLRAVAPHRVIIRTFDLGGDKLGAENPASEERNPFLGFRAIRYCLSNPDIFKAQLRAILRVSANGNAAIMYPMVSCLEELHEAARLLAEAKDELRLRNQPFNDAIPVGAMIEIPAAALIAEHLAAHLRFFSLGTNDLVQYTIAVDRVNERVAGLYQPTHPGVLRLVDMTVQAAHRNGLWVGVCGEMAGDPRLTPLLLGLGVDELSMTPSSIPLVKDMVRKTAFGRAQALAAAALKESSSARVMDLCRDLIRETAPEILELIP